MNQNRAQAGRISEKTGLEAGNCGDELAEAAGPGWGLGLNLSAVPANADKTIAAQPAEIHAGV